MRNKSVLQEAQDIQKAVELIRLGARMQMLEAETALSRERLLKLYKEVKGVSPPKGMLPFSTDWFMSWQPNIHASLFMALYRFVKVHAKLDGLDAIVHAYRLYAAGARQEPLPGNQCRRESDLLWDAIWSWKKRAGDTHQSACSSDRVTPLPRSSRRKTVGGHEAEARAVLRANWPSGSEAEISRHISIR